jgi:Zn-dependent M28 family amino/carboxypeptidase
LTNRNQRMLAVVFAAATVALLAAALMALVTQPLVTPLRSTPPEVDPARLEAHVRRLTIDFYPRSYDQRGNLQRAAQYVFDQFKAAGADVEFQDVIVRGATYKNVVARFGPMSGPLLVIGAHYDSNGVTDTAAGGAQHYSPETRTPGADDNASGVAGLIELARLLGRESQTRAIELVAYTLEEPPHFATEHMGSEWHARALVAAKRQVALMLSLEMIGYFSDAPGSQRYPEAGMVHLYPDRADFIALVGKLSDFSTMRKAKALMAGATDLPVYTINAPPQLQGIDFSDHRSYWNEGLPALMVTDTAFFRNANYHQAGDTYDTLDYRRMAKVVQSVYALIRGF